MSKRRLDRIERALKPDDMALLAIEDKGDPDKSTYSAWSGVPGNKSRQITKKTFTKLSEHNHAVIIIDDIDEGEDHENSEKA